MSQPISGHILVSSGIVGDGEASHSGAACLSALDRQEPDCSSIALAGEARLSGIDFKLFDPRELHPGADRLSFVFLEAKSMPLLDGSLVAVGHSEGRGEWNGESFRLGTPSIRLQSYLEDWTDLLFSWVKYFFVEDLSWRRREAMQGYEDYREVFLDVATTLGAERAETATFEAIVATFAQHAKHWSEEMAAGAEA